MTRDEMLKRMKLTDEEFKDLIHKFRNFNNSLNEHQREVVTRSLPTVAVAAKSFGPDVTAGELEKLLGIDFTTGAFGASGIDEIRNK
jgi:hypothetical protein